MRSLALAAAVSLLSLPLAQAADTGIDVLLILDNSGSMRSNDARALRVEAAKLFVGLLSENDRVSVFRFSGNTEVLSEMLSLSTERHRTRLLNSIDRVTSRGARTDFYKALNEGYQLMRQTQRPGRQQHIILMTDGKMDSGKASVDLNLTDRLLSNLGPKFARARIKVHTISFTDTSNIPLLRLISNDTKGSFNLLKGQSGIHEIFESIFERSAKPSMLPMKGDSFVVDSAVSEITIIASKYKPNTIVALETPHGDTYTPQNHPSRIRWYHAKQYDLITIKHPSTGYWLVKFSEGGNRAYIITDLKLVIDAPNEVKLGESFNVTAWFEQKEKRIQTKRVLSAMNIKLKVISPSGTVGTYRLNSIGKGRSRTSILPTESGTYKLQAIGIGEEFDRQRSTFVNVVHGDSNEPFKVVDADAATQNPAVKEEQSQSADSLNSNSIKHPTDPLSKDATESKSLDTAKSVANNAINQVEKIAEEIKDKIIPKPPAPAIQEEDSSSGFGLLIFLIFNVVTVIGGGIWYYLRQKRKANWINLDGRNSSGNLIDTDSNASVNLTDVDIEGNDESVALEEEGEIDTTPIDDLRKDDD